MKTLSYKKLKWGYSLDLNITDKCNIQCSHCYMPKRDLSLTKESAQLILKKIPKTLERLVISGGEPFLNYEVLYEIVRLTKLNFKSRIRITTNGKFLYELKDKLSIELQKLDNFGVDELVFSSDRHHFEAGIKYEKLLDIQEEIYKLGLNLKCKFLDVGEGVLIGEFIKKNPKKFEINNCLNRKVNIVKPYFFTSTEGDVYLCAFRNSPSLGNLLNEDWEIVSSRINDQMNLLCGNIFPYLVKKIYTDELVNDYLTYGECYVCQKYLNSKKIK